MKSKSLLFVPALAAAAAATTPTTPNPASFLPSSLTSIIQNLLPSIPGLTLTPQIATTFTQPLAVDILRNTPITREGTTLRLGSLPWNASGANVYWMGLDENVIPPPGQPFYAPTNASYPTLGRITEVMNGLATLGARSVRGHTLGISVGNPLSVMPAPGVVNQQAFETIDWAVYQARQHGIRIFAPLVDNYDYYHGGKFVWLRWAGFNLTGDDSTNPEVMQFYTNQTIVDAFKGYIHTLLTHTNQYTGLTYAEDPTIFAYETGNELGGPVFGDMWVPVEWTTQIADYIKELAPNKLVIDGTYGVNTTHLAIPSLDIFSDHYYPPNMTKLADDIALVQGAGKTYIAGEYDWTGNNPAAAPLPEFFSALQASAQAGGPVVGDMFWSLFMHDVPDCNIFVNHTDGETLQYGNPLNTVQNNTQISLIREHLFSMRGETVGPYLPAVACPGYKPPPTTQNPTQAMDSPTPSPPPSPPPQDEAQPPPPPAQQHVVSGG
ncbi:glycoside hydrolase superfamily [Hygrophoropsis aurantiaca]|uniref:Glycoside hydrolase superfamily n=1 Tax=Hygrophoropsis aurantiaca TaxID=72124 RepID=A0ACB8A8N9_9AGAM|nr:glycoside hydrolase superfamily [Hygrophoropsis aurantiaca]